MSSLDGSLYDSRQRLHVRDGDQEADLSAEVANIFFAGSQSDSAWLAPASALESISEERIALRSTFAQGSLKEASTEVVCSATAAAPAMASTGRSTRRVKFGEGEKVRRVSFPGEGVYMGECDLSGKRSGSGKMWTLEGSVYEGSWSRDLKEGDGKETCATDAHTLHALVVPVHCSRYCCMYIITVWCGCYSYADGATYQGQYRAGQRHGHGTIHYANGDTYEGAWDADNKHGNGTFHWVDGGQCMSIARARVACILHVLAHVRCSRPAHRCRRVLARGGPGPRHPHVR